MRLKNIAKRETKDIIKVTESALEKIAIMADIMQGLEFGCLSGGDEKQDEDTPKVINDFLIAKNQEVGSIHCNLEIGGYFDTIKELSKRKLIQLGIAHGHGHCGSMHSTKDDKALQSMVLPSLTSNDMEFWPSKENPQKTISRVSSIVVNQKLHVFAEMWYREKDLTSKAALKEKYSKETHVEAVSDSKFPNYTVDKNKKSIIQTLVSNINFPLTIAVPQAFTIYKKQYDKLKSKKRNMKLRVFAENLSELAKNGSVYRENVEEFIKRIDNKCNPRLKYATKSILSFDHVLDLFAFFTEQEYCPEWFFDLMKDAEQLKGPKGQKIIKKFLPEIDDLFNSKQSILDSPIELSDLLSPKIPSSIEKKPENVPVYAAESIPQKPEIIKSDESNILNAYDLLRQVRYFKEKKIKNKSQNYLSEAGRYIAEISKEIKELSVYTKKGAVIDNTKKELQKQKNELHKHISNTLVKTQKMIKNLSRFSQTTDNDAEINAKYSEVKILLEDAKKLPLAKYEQQVIKLDKMLEAI